MGNNPFLRAWHLEMSILVAPFDREANPTKNVINMLHCFAPHPLSVAPIANGDVARENRLLAASGEMVDPLLSDAST
jgi:hypothetical protein